MPQILMALIHLFEQLGYNWWRKDFACLIHFSNKEFENFFCEYKYSYPFPTVPHMTIAYQNILFTSNVRILCLLGYCQYDCDTSIQESNNEWCSIENDFKNTYSQGFESKWYQSNLHVMFKRLLLIISFTTSFVGTIL